MNYFLDAIKSKYAQFSGRARRAEYWQFFLFNIIVSIVLNVLVRTTGSMLIAGVSGLVSLALLIPGIAVGVRRMHDVNKSGWFILVPIYNLILAVTPGTVGPNEYGPDPKGATDSFLTSEPEVY
ncbi:MAG: DUF805 domain-containing protein [Hymenobacter sp.]|nr:MAG: DUF805 domain-containing protein [Hymenobacter sp.]